MTLGQWIVVGVLIVLACLVARSLRNAPVCNCPIEDECGGGCIKWKRR